jgi:hypothetical protein
MQHVKSRPSDSIAEWPVSRPRHHRLRTFAEQSVALRLKLEQTNGFARLATACAELMGASSVVIPGVPAELYHAHRRGIDPLNYLDPADLPPNMVRRAELITAEHPLVQPSAPLQFVRRALLRKDLGFVLALPLGNGGTVLLFAEENRDLDIHDWQMLAALCVRANSSIRCPLPAGALTPLASRRSELELRAALDYGHRASLAGCQVALGKLNLDRLATCSWSRISWATANPFVHDLLSLHCTETGGVGCAHWLASGQVLLLLVGASAASGNARLASLTKTGPASVGAAGFLKDYDPFLSEAEAKANAAAAA